jgi:hypothetical protein
VIVPASQRHGAADELETAATVIDARPAALINGKAVTWGELRPALTELAGADALQELILDQRLAASLADAGIVITPDDAVGERKLLLESLHDDPNVAVRMLEELRNRQKLGKARFESLLMRNAGLRALVRAKVTIAEQAVRAAHDVAHGPKRQPRLMVVPDLKTAEDAISRISGGQSFADVAIELSSDSSAARGGLLEPISRDDPAYPQALRQTLWTLAPGEVSTPVLLDGSYALLTMVKDLPEDGVSLEEVRPQLERAVRLSQERLMMDQLARTMLTDASVKIFDDALDESWRRARTQER